jgi:hypothetical protein
MARNLTGSKRGWGWDSTIPSLDLFADGAIASKYANAENHPDLYTTDTTQKYALGTRLQVDDRVFRYCRAGSALIRYIGGANNDQWSLTNEEPNQSASIGDTSIQVVNTTGTKGLYIGGWVVIFSDPLQMRRIVDNDASDGTDITLYLDGALEAAITKDSTWVTAYPSIYYDIYEPSNVTGGGEDYISFVCVPVCTVASGEYFWGQTWGPCYGVADVTVPGSAVGQREIYFATSGNLSDYGDNLAGTGAQRAGFLLPQTASGAGDQLYMLQISP